MSPAFRFDREFRARLSQLATDLVRAQGAAGEAGRATPAPGQADFRDHRPYVAGDDVRFLDWNVFMRSGTLALKTYVHEEAARAVVVLDRSASMGPAGSTQDVRAREIAAAIGFLALRAGGEAVLVDAADGPPRSHRGARAVDAWIACVEAAPDPGGRDRTENLVRAAAARGPGRLVAWVSDFLADPLPAAAFTALGRTAAQRLAFVVCAHDDVLAAVRPGDTATLGDPEGTARLAARSDAAWRQAWAEERAAHVAAVAAIGARHRFTTVACTGDVAFEDAILRALRPR